LKKQLSGASFSLSVLFVVLIPSYPIFTPFPETARNNTRKITPLAVGHAPDRSSSNVDDESDNNRSVVNTTATSSILIKNQEEGTHHMKIALQQQANVNSIEQQKN